MFIIISVILILQLLFVQDIFIGLVNSSFFFILKIKIFDIIKDNDQKRSNIFLSGDVEPGSIRGGLAGEFLVLLFYKFLLII
jgi:hypothetical protein